MEYYHLKDIDLKANIGQRVFGIFLATDVEVRLQKDKVTKFISFNMVDKDIKEEAKRFSATENEIALLKSGGVYRAAIDIKPYDKAKNGYSCILYNFEPYTEESSSNFIQWADGMTEAQESIQTALDYINESIYKTLVYNLLVDKWNNFCTWTAASSMHHNCLGGLLVHTGEVIDQCIMLADYWDSKYGEGFINKGLLLSAALLHDLAKVLELNVDALSGTTEYSVAASLETHITMCVSLIDIEAYKEQLGYQIYTINDIGEQEETKSIETIKYEKEAIALLKHCVLSHHGKLEYGSPIKMNCPEAYILNKADELSAEMYRYNKEFNTMESGTSVSSWVSGNMVTTYKDSTK